jgi:hypothetical protein
VFTPWRVPGHAAPDHGLQSYRELRWRGRQDTTL